MARTVKIALLAIRRANAMPSWRGVLLHLAEALRVAGADVVVCELGDSWLGLLFTVKEWWIRRILQRRYQRHREPRILRDYGRRTAAFLAKHRVDCAISLKVFPIAYAPTTVPLIVYNDAPFRGLLNFYSEFSGMHPRHILDGERMEQAAGNRAVHSIYSSSWAATIASTIYGISPDRLSIVEMGANVARSHTRTEIESLVQQRGTTPRWEFLWLGVEWERKRGTMAVAIVERLRLDGYDVHLTIAGAGRPIGAIESLPWVTWISFLSADALASTLAGTDFLLLPTEADCTPLVLNEANAFGVPVFVTNVGGIASQIHDSINGVLVRPEADVEEWVAAITPHLGERSTYSAFALRAFEESRHRLNWDVAARRILEIARRYISHS